MKAVLSKGKKFIGDSVILYFNYNKDIVSYLQRLPIRTYDPKDKSWEIPLEQFARFKDFYKRPIDLVVSLHKDKKPVIDIPQDFKFKVKPFEHQLNGVKFGLNHNNFLLADSQGMGKTFQTINIAVIKKKLYNYKHCLIICAVNGSKYNWKKECSMYSDEQAHILGERTTKSGKTVIKSNKAKLEDISNIDDMPYFIITNKETLRDKDIVKELQKQQDKIDMCIFDEIHLCSTVSSQQGKGLLKVGGKSKIALSGTPVLNSPLDTYMTMKWLGYEDHTLTAFKQRYCIFGGFTGYQVVGYKNVKELQERFKDVQLRRLKQDCLNLPDKIHTVEYLEMGDRQKIIYDEVYNNITNNVDEDSLSPNPLVRIIRLRQATGYPGILNPNIKDSVKYDRCIQIVEDLKKEGRKCLIFSNWVEMLKPLYTKLSKYNPALIIGETKDIIEQEKQRLNTDPECHCALGTIGAMGTSHTLTGADTVIFLDEPWNRGTKEQCEDRVHRIGTKNNVTIITFICKNTVDERINNIVNEKGQWADCIVDGKVRRNQKELLTYLLS